MASKEKSIRVWLPPVVNKEYELYDRQFQGFLCPGNFFAKPRGRDFKLTCIPTLLAAPPPKQYSSPTLIPPATQARVAHTNRGEQEKKNIWGAGGGKGLKRKGDERARPALFFPSTSLTLSPPPRPPAPPPRIVKPKKILNSHKCDPPRLD